MKHLYSLTLFLFITGAITAQNVGIGSNIPQHLLSVGENTSDGQLITFRSYSNTGAWKGGGAFGYDQASVIMGELSGMAQLGGHNAPLSAWADLLINSGGGNVGIGIVTTPIAKLQVGGNLLLQYGTAVNEFSTDGTLGGNSNDALPTEQAVKTYVDNSIAGADEWTLSGNNLYPNSAAYNVGIGGATTPQHTLTVGVNTADNQVVDIRGYSNDPSFWKGGAAFGYTSASVIMGEVGGFAQIGGHNADLSAWADLILQSGGGRVGIGTTGPTEMLGVQGNIRVNQSNTTGGGIVLADDGDIADMNDGFASMRFSYGVRYTNANRGGSVVAQIANGAGGHETYFNAGNVGIGTNNPESLLHVMGRTHIHQSGAGGGQNRFEGVEGATTANGRAQLILSSSYSDLVIASSQANDNHGSTLTFAAYNPANAGDYRKFVLNQGGWGARSGFLDFSYGAGTGFANPHSAAYAAHTTMTIDGVNKRIGIGTMTPESKLHIITSGARNPSGNAIYAYNPSVGGDAIITTRVEQGTGGDPFFSMDIGGVTGWSVGIDNSDGDKFKISNSWSDPGVNNRVAIHTDGTAEFFGRVDARAGLRTERYYRYFTIHRNANGAGYQYDLGQWDYCAYAGHQIALGDDTFDGGSDNRRFVHECVVELNDVWTLNNVTGVTTQGGYAYNSRPNWYLYQYSWAQFDQHMNQHCSAVCVNFDY